MPLEGELADLDARELRLVDAIERAGISEVIADALARVRARRSEVRAALDLVSGGLEPFDIEEAVEEVERQVAAVSSVAALRGWIDRVTIDADGQVTIEAFARSVSFAT